MTHPSKRALERKARLSLIDQALPRHRDRCLEIALDYDPDVSCEHFIMSFLRYNPAEHEPVEELHRICRAFDLNRPGEDRLTYVREICTMVAPVLQHGYTLEDLKPVLGLATQKWDMLAVFLELDNFLSAQAKRYHMVPIQNGREHIVQQEVSNILDALRLNAKKPQ